MAKGYLETHTSTDEAALQKLENALGNYHDLEIKAQEEIFDLRKNNLERLAKLQVQQLNSYKQQQIDTQQKVNERLIKMGFKVGQVVNKKNLEERLKDIDAEEKAALKGKRGKNRQAIKEEYAEKRKQEQEFEKAKSKLSKEETKKRAKEQGKQLLGALKDAYSDKGLTTLGGALFGWKAAKQTVQENLIRKDDETDAEYNKRVKKATAALQLHELANAMSDFAKQLEGTINGIAESQTAIDTRLYGSSNRKWEGSMWRAMSQDIVRYVGMSPIIKQSAVVDNLKTMVGQGISFNVEQRALIATIRDGVATTFDALDGSLTKLVRIQQEDTTASRLGMEAALNAFLNNMYETTEYMTDAAKDIRAQIYEASALMTAKTATEFEYQVQKWMGSLYSVGFNNSSGLAGALGKLAAGDISGVTDGGYGNLLVMAANRAGLSISEILADGLDSSSTNQLMEAMVGYLGQIYNETKGSNLLAQQYASVFGLTASDLKAAANLSNSLTNIAGNGLTNAGMLKNLTDMTNSMRTRTSTGGMMTNLFDNLKYATANTMANNPVLYATYTLASMLDSTVGGIAIPSIMAMGTGFDLETTVADLMRVSTLGAGLLGGIGTMISGLATGNGIGSSALLKNFGIGTKEAIVTRGTGAGLITTGGATTSESGSMIGNANGSDVQNKTMTGATDDAKQQVAEAQGPDAIELKDVNEQVVRIAELLEKVTDGTAKFHVDIDDEFSWTDSSGHEIRGIF